MIAGRYKSAEYLHYYHQPHQSEHQLAQFYFDSRQNNYYCHYQSHHQPPKHHSVRRSSLQPQHNHRNEHHYQPHNYPWECNGRAHYFGADKITPSNDGYKPSTTKADEKAFDLADTNCHRRRARRQLPIEPKTAAEPPLMKSAHSANTLLNQEQPKQQSRTQQMAIGTGMPMASANGSISNSWSNRLNKAGGGDGGGTKQRCQQDENSGECMPMHRNSHPSLFNNTEAKQKWPTAADQNKRAADSSFQMVMATSPKVRALRRGTSTAMSSSTARPSLISQRSLQGAITSPKLAQKKMPYSNRSTAPNDQQRQNWDSNLADMRKISAGAYFYASNSSYNSPFIQNEKFSGHFTPPSSGVGTSYANDSPQSHNSPSHAPQYFPVLFNKQQHLANVRASSNPTICCRRGGGIERQILRRSPNSDLAPRFQRHQQTNDQHQQQDECSRGSSFSSESALAGKNGPAGGAGGSSTEQDPDTIDPVYLALKQATEKYGTPAGSRRGSQNVVTMMADSLTPSPRDLSQASLQDSGTYSGSEYCGTGAMLRRHAFPTGGGSTPHLHGISVGKSSLAGITANGEGTNGTNCQQPLSNGGRRPKLSEKMKSLSLDCAEMPDPVQNGMIRPQYKSKPLRSARGGLAEISVQQSFDKSVSPCGRLQSGPLATAVQQAPQKQRRLPPVPSAVAQPPQPQQQALIVSQQPQSNQQPPNNIMHIVTHEYSSAECVLRPGERVVVVDNGDPDWKHGFKFNDCLEHLMTFPSSCVTAYHMEEQPMKLLQSCNLVEQKIRLYRDQIVFAQPNGLSEDGRLLLVRNEHSKFAHCPLQFLALT